MRQRVSRHARAAVSMPADLIFGHTATALEANTLGTRTSAEWVGWAWVALRPDAATAPGWSTTLARGGGMGGPRQSNNRAELRAL
eukprot:4804429-Lingulodinium_polyedra.AAC.1